MYQVLKPIRHKPANSLKWTQKFQFSHQTDDETLAKYLAKRLKGIVTINGKVCFNYSNVL